MCARLRIVVSAAISAWLAFFPMTWQAQDLTTPEYRRKATFLANFPSFVEWPVGTSATTQTPFVVCVYGAFPFGTSLVNAMRNQTAHGRQITVQLVRKEPQAQACQMLFVSRSDMKHYEKILSSVRGTAVLSVGETPEFLDAGGMLTFALEQDKLRFDVNLDAANEGHLKISSALLKMARHIVNKTELAKN